MGSALLNAVLLLFMAVIFFLSSNFQKCEGAMPKLTLKRIKKVNKNGPYVGMLTTTTDELEPLKALTTSFKYPYIDCDGKRFHIGRIKKKKVIFAMTGKGMTNAAVVSKLLLSLFDVRAILHYGTVANANPGLNTGDVVVPWSWAHTGLWSWQRYGGSPDEELPLESEGYFTRTIGSLNFSDFIHHHGGGGGGGGGGEDDDDDDEGGDEGEEDNFLNSVWFQPEEIFSINRTAESSDKVFWVAVYHKFMELAKKLSEDIKLKGCISNSTCLPNKPKVAVVEKGSSSNIYLDNVAFRTFLHSKFQVTPVDMESAAIALTSQQHKVPFIVFRALSDLAGERPPYSTNGAHDFRSLATRNSAKVALKFLKKMEIPKIDPNLAGDLD